MSMDMNTSRPRHNEEISEENECAYLRNLSRNFENLAS